MFDLDRNQFHLAGTDEPVFFDINVDGVKDKMTWTAAGTRDALLCFDRNGNGTIDDGTELFGTGTPLLFGGYASHGYKALIEVDSPHLAGNQDWILDEEDALFSSLCLWTDTNHDAVSQSEELTDLRTAGILGVDLEYRASRQRDQHGNTLRYWSTYWFESKGKIRRGSATGVFFLEIE